MTSLDHNPSSSNPQPPELDQPRVPGVRRTALVLLIAMGLSPAFVTATPTREGHEARVHGSTGKYAWVDGGACGAQAFSYRSREIGGGGSYAYKEDNLTLKAATKITRDHVLSGEFKDCPAGQEECSPQSPPRLGDRNGTFAASGRVGYDGTFGGADLGIAFVPESPTLVLPATSLWFGHRYFFAYGDLLTAEGLVGHPIYGLGVGHENPYFQLRAGYEVAVVGAERVVGAAQFTTAANLQDKYILGATLASPITNADEEDTNLGYFGQLTLGVRWQ